MNQDSKQLQYLYYLDLKCIDTLATLIQEEQQADPGAGSNSHSTNCSASNSQSENGSESSLVSGGDPSASPKNDMLDKVKNTDGRALYARSGSGRSLVGTSEGKRARERSITSSSVLGTPAGPSSPVSPDSAANLTAKDIRKICPILAALSKEIGIFFKDVPEVLEMLHTETANISSAPSPFISFQKECSAFLSGNFLKVDHLSANQQASWMEIHTLLRIIIDFPKSQHDIEPDQSLFNLIDITDRILKNAPRYTNQTAEMPSKGKRINLTQGEVFTFMEKVVRKNSAYEERLQKSPSMISNEARGHLEKLIEISQARMDSQSYQMTKQKEDRFRAGVFGDLVDKGEKSRLSDQEWISPKIQKETDIDIISEIANKSDPILSEKQRFHTSESKQKEMYIAKVEGVLERNPRMKDQQSLSKDEIMEKRLAPLLSSLENMPQRLDNQTASPITKKRRNTTTAQDHSEISPELSLSPLPPPKMDTNVGRVSTNTPSVGMAPRMSAVQDDANSAKNSPTATGGRRRSSISAVVKGIARRASAVFRPKVTDSSPIDAVDELESVQNAIGAKPKHSKKIASTDILSLGEILSTGPKKTNTHQEASSKAATLEYPLPSKANSKSSEQVNANNNQGGIMGKLKSLMKPSTSTKDLAEIAKSSSVVDNTNNLQQQSNRNIAGSTGSIKALFSSLTVKKSGGDTTKKKSSKGEIGKAAAGAEIINDADFSKEQGAECVAFEKPQSINPPQPPPLSNTPKPLQMLPLKSQNTSTETIELKSPEERAARIPISPISPMDYAAAAAAGNKRRSKLRTSVNQEELEKLNQRTVSPTSSQSQAKRTSVNKVTPTGLNNGGVAFMNLKTINGSGSTLPDLDVDRTGEGIRAQALLTQQDPNNLEEVKSEPATMQATSSHHEATISVLSDTAAMPESKIHAALYSESISNSLDSNNSS